MAINPTAAAYITNEPDTNAAVVDIDVKGADNSTNRQSGRALVVTISGTLNPDGSYSPGFSAGAGGGGGTAFDGRVQGTVASGATDSGNPVKVGGLVNGTVPTALTTGQRSDMWSTLNGASVIGAPIFAGIDGVLNSNIASVAGAGGANGIRPLAVAPYVFDSVAGTWPRVRGDSSGSYSVQVGSSSSAAAITPVVGAGVFTLTIKATAGNFYGGSILAGATAGYLIAYNTAAAPTVGNTLTAAQILGAVPVAANGAAALGDYAIPDRFSAGVLLIFSTSLTTYTQPANPALFMRGRAA